MRHIILTVAILTACGPQVCDTPQCETAYEICVTWADAQCRQFGEWGALDRVPIDEDEQGEACEAGLRDGWEDAGC